MHLLFRSLLWQSNNLAWGFELPNCAFVSLCKGSSRNEKLESITRKRSGRTFIELEDLFAFLELNENLKDFLWFTKVMIPVLFLYQL